VNLFQGADPVIHPGQASYPGDRNLFDFEVHPHLIVLQIHRVHPRGMEDVDEVFTLGVRLGAMTVVRRGSR
jgi:hypothetical protein